MQKAILVVAFTFFVATGCQFGSDATSTMSKKQDDGGPSSTTDAVTATSCTPETAVEKCGTAAGSCVLPECTEYVEIGTFACFYVEDPRCAPPVPQSDAGTVQQDAGVPQSDAAPQSDASPQSDATPVQSDATPAQEDAGVPFSSTCANDSDCAPRAGQNVYGVCCSDQLCRYFRVGDTAQCTAIQQDAGTPQSDAAPVQSDAAPQTDATVPAGMVRLQINAVCHGDAGTCSAQTASAQVFDGTPDPYADGGGAAVWKHTLPVDVLVSETAICSWDAIYAIKISMENADTTWWGGEQYCDGTHSMMTDLAVLINGSPVTGTLIKGSGACSDLMVPKMGICP